VIEEGDDEVETNTIIADVKELVEKIKIKVSEKGTIIGEFKFKAFLAKELPALVQLQFGLPRQYMLDDGNEEDQGTMRKSLARQMLKWAAKDDKWPDMDKNECLLVGEPQWQIFKDDKGKPILILISIFNLTQRLWENSNYKKKKECIDTR